MSGVFIPGVWNLHVIALLILLARSPKAISGCGNVYTIKYSQAGDDTCSNWIYSADDSGGKMATSCSID